MANLFIARFNNRYQISDYIKSKNYEQIIKFTKPEHFNYILTTAVEEDNEFLVDYAIQNGANYFNQALLEACENYNRRMFNYMLHKGACNYNGALLKLCSYYNGDMYFIKKIIGFCTNITQSMERVYTKGRLDLQYYLINKGGKWWKILKKNNNITTYKLCVKNGMKVYKYKHNKRLREECPVYNMFVHSFNKNNKLLYSLPTEIYRLINEYV